MTNLVDTNIMENFFDQMDDLLDFPTDNVEVGCFGTGSVDVMEFPPIWSDDSPEFSAGCHSHSASDLSAELSVPYEDIVQLEWLSTFVEDSFSGGGLTIKRSESASKEDGFRNQFQTTSPISVLESSSSSCSKGKIFPIISHEKRARSKRPRPATFTPRAAMQLIAPASSSITAVSGPIASSDSENFAESYLSFKGVNQQKKKKRKIKVLPPSGGQSDTISHIQNENPNAASVRKCSHCEITKTPQWRTGPKGPKSLCNACGVRYKSGRLFPEYRPAASPTFIPALHSNSHKKVLEMRGTISSEGGKSVSNAAAAPPSRKVELIPRSDLVPTHM